MNYSSLMGYHLENHLIPEEVQWEFWLIPLSTQSHNSVIDDLRSNFAECVKGFRNIVLASGDCQVEYNEWGININLISDNVTIDIETDGIGFFVLTTEDGDTIFHSQGNVWSLFEDHTMSISGSAPSPQPKHLFTNFMGIRKLKI